MQKEIDLIKMHDKSFETKDLLVKYAVDHSLRLLPIQARLLKVTLELPQGGMVAAPEVTQLLMNLVKYTNGKKLLEIGVFTGFTTLGLAMSIPDDGKIVACDVHNDYVNIGRPFWKEAGVSHKIEVKIQPAAKSLDELLAKGEAGTYDMAFIDADKGNYELYYEKCLQLLRKGGLIAVDNVLWDRSVLDKNSTRMNAKDIKKFNDKLKDDERIDINLLTIGDGLTLAFKK